ncbi:nucleoside triphosphate pyrophosphohydrolase family protein [Dictyobacter arantiisoli]|uniref:Nucleotide pyrophosphohydrolase n=1 Tax=Dictyobacter arantiisoli TaxID=2014874 RepID=A0A5A5TJY3_9CHLR|nr:nucleoside triphosphate pyrophosphohydrolase family protein [Dictyobacter arantiisoli]GCF11333.1 nucleotide pyrophosphohydrolase [Dictyobacter arantiisoli]
MDTTDTPTRITIQEYAQEIHRTCNLEDPKELLTLTALGIAGESGEIVDTLKKFLYHQHDLDVPELCKEVGDLLWYMTLLCDTLGLTMHDVMEANVKKLRKRYPDGFDAQRSRVREE